ncbi:hypothetical protein M0804_003603 [Polistes exclamans]|nr:hypothetical protein M0804_003603 [Polistes exclamans]
MVVVVWAQLVGGGSIIAASGSGGGGGGGGADVLVDCAVPDEERLQGESRKWVEVEVEVEPCACIRNAIVPLSSGARALLSPRGRAPPRAQTTAQNSDRTNTNLTDIDLRPIICMLIVRTSDENSDDTDDDDDDDNDKEKDES